MAVHFFRERRTSEAWLIWLLHLGKVDLRKATKAQREKFCSEVQEFCCDHAYSPQGAALDRYIPISGIRRDLRMIQGKVHALLTDLIEAREKPEVKSRGQIKLAFYLMPRVSLGIWLGRAEKLPHLEAERQVFPPPTNWAEEQIIRAHQKAEKEALALPDGTIYKAYVAKWPDIFWVALIDLLVSQGPKLRRCSQCGVLFVRTRRQEYCSKKCSQKVRSNRWYETNKVKARTQRREAYRRRKVKELGPKVRVRSRVSTAAEEEGAKHGTPES